MFSSRKSYAEKHFPCSTFNLIFQSHCKKCEKTICLNKSCWHEFCGSRLTCAKNFLTGKINYLYTTITKLICCTRIMEWNVIEIWQNIIKIYFPPYAVTKQCYSIINQIHFKKKLLCFPYLEHWYGKQQCHSNNYGKNSEVELQWGNFKNIKSQPPVFF